MYGLLGTSSQVHIGPFALVSMMVSSSLSYINPDENFDDYLGAVTTLCFICGVIHLVLGLCYGGIVTRLLSETIVTAFTTASAFNIGGSQLKHLWGVSCSDQVFLKIVRSLYRFAKPVQLVGILDGWLCDCGSVSDEGTE